MITEEALRKHLQTFVECLNAGEFEIAWSHMLEDGRILTTIGSLLQGREAVIQQTQTNRAKFGLEQVSVTLVEFRSLGNSIATAICSWAFTTKGQTSHALTLSIYQEIRGELWLVHGATVEQK